MGIDSRRKSLFARIHGRYHTIGFADVRAEGDSFGQECLFLLDYGIWEKGGK